MQRAGRGSAGVQVHAEGQMFPQLEKPAVGQGQGVLGSGRPGRALPAEAPRRLEIALNANPSSRQTAGELEKRETPCAACTAARCTCVRVSGPRRSLAGEGGGCGGQRHALQASRAAEKPRRPDASPSAFLAVSYSQMHTSIWFQSSAKRS